MMVLICSALYLPLIQVNFCLPSDAIVSYSTPTAPLMFYEIFKMKQEGNKYIKLSMIQLQGFFFCTKKNKKITETSHSRLASGGDISKNSKHENSLSHMNYQSSLLSKNLRGGSYSASLLSN